MLRYKYRIIRKNIKNKIKKDNAIYYNIVNNKKVKTSNIILIYVSIKEEVDTIKLIKHFLKTKLVAVPKIVNNKLNFYYIKSLSELKKGYFDILEPITNNKVYNYENCVCLTPGICFDVNNFRVGYGKGFYDEFLKNNYVYSIGICYKECVVDKINVNINDIMVNEIITD